MTAQEYIELIAIALFGWALLAPTFTTRQVTTADDTNDNDNTGEAS